MQIGQVAARTELSIATVRHYDEVGLVTPSARSTGGFRLYTEVDVDRLLVIRRMKPLGFTLTEMKDLLDSLDILNGGGTSKKQRTAAAHYLQQCRTKAEESAEKLRKHLAYAEELTELLAARAAEVVGE
ncbi:MAG: MerR family transcriptional regulator [Mycobacterium sp.]|jgi:MerR family transcriptional regulator, copper efflux regulator|nr:MerR family transcriptional regulator [Mycobacterium sp.]